MPKLVDQTEIKQVFLPSTKIDAAGNPLPQDQWGWVALDVGPATARDVLAVDGDQTDGETSVRGLLNRIKEWNLTDENDEVLPITYENICKMDIDDFSYLNKLPKKSKEGLSIDEKKDLSPTSPQSGTIEVQTP